MALIVGATVSYAPAFFAWYEAFTGDPFRVPAPISADRGILWSLLLWLPQFLGLVLIAYSAWILHRQRQERGRYTASDHRNLQDAYDSLFEQHEADRKRLRSAEESRDKLRRKAHDEENLRAIYEAQRDALRQDVKTLESRVEELSQYAPAPPPPSDLDPHEKAVALNELGKIVKVAVKTHEHTLHLLGEIASELEQQHGDVGVELSRVKISRLKSPLSERLNDVRDAISAASSAEQAQEKLLAYVIAYESARHWMSRSARLASVDPSDLWPERYRQWWSRDAAFWAKLDEVTEMGPLRYLDSLLRTWQVPGEVPVPMPQPVVMPSAGDTEVGPNRGGEE